METFTCEKCGETFNKAWTEEEAKKEFLESPWNIPGDGIAVICHDCFEQFKIWFNSLTEEQHKKYRNKIKGYN